MFDELRSTQHGVVDLRQALACGITRDAVRAHIDSGRWQRLHRGVFATFSGPVTRQAAVWAAWLSCGDGAVVSHHTAAELVGLVDDVRPDIHVTVPSSRRLAPRPGLILHISGRIGERRHPSRLPAQTRVEHTVFDMIAQTPSEDEAFGWLSMACGRRLTTPHRLGQALSSRPKMKWRRELAEALNDVQLGCHSVLERRYLRDVERAHGLPMGTRQAAAGRSGRGRVSGGGQVSGGGRIYRDVRYPGLRTIVELDGRAAHPAERRFRDLRRDNVSAMLDEIVLHFGWADVTARPCAVAMQVASVLRAHGWRGRPSPCGGRCMIAPRFVIAKD